MRRGQYLFSVADLHGLLSLGDDVRVVGLRVSPDPDVLHVVVEGPGVRPYPNMLGICAAESAARGDGAAPILVHPGRWADWQLPVERELAGEEPAREEPVGEEPMPVQSFGEFAGGIVDRLVREERKARIDQAMARVQRLKERRRTERPRGFRFVDSRKIRDDVLHGPVPEAVVSDPFGDNYWGYGDDGEDDSDSCPCVR